LTQASDFFAKGEKRDSFHPEKQQKQTPNDYTACSKRTSYPSRSMLGCGLAGSGKARA